MINLCEELQVQCQDERVIFFINAGEELVKKQMQEDMTVLQKPSFSLDIGSFVIINNIPQITADKEIKMVQVLKQIMNKQQLQTDYIDVKINLTGQALIKFVSDESAYKGALLMNDFQMGAQNILQAFTIKDFNSILQTKNQYEKLNLKTKSQLQNWLTDSQRRNQIVYIQDRNKLTLEWFLPLQGALESVVKEVVIPVADRIEWSRNGSYLVLYSEEGFSLYGGNEQFELLHSFSHRGVRDIVFSSDEELCLSYNGTKIQTDSTENFVLWKVREEIKLRTFKAEQLDILESFQFSGDSKWFAKIDNDMLSFYKEPNFFLYEKPLKSSNIQNFIWVAKSNFVCYACFTGSQRENDKVSKPQIIFYEVNTKREFRWRVITHECDRIELFSNTYGKWVVAIITKKIKKKVVSTLVQVANVKRWDNNLEVVSEEVQEEYERAFIEPRTGKIALCFRDKNARAGQAYNFSFFVVDDTKSIGLKSAGTFSQKETNEVMWSNSGTYFAFVNNMRGSPDQGKIDFAMVTKKTVGDQVSYSIEITKSTNHFYMSHCFWDPSGIYFVTMSDQWNSVIIWSAIGEQVYKDTITKISYINWRNKPSNILNDKEEQSLISLPVQKEYTKRYEEEDDKVINKNKHEREFKRENMKNQFQALMTQKQNQWKQAREERKNLLGFDADDRTKLHSIEIIEREEIVNEQQL